MRKTYPLHIEGRHSDRVLDAIKHDIRKYVRRQRRASLPEGMDFWDFDCRLGLSAESAETVHFGNLITGLDTLAKAGEQGAPPAVFVEVRGRAAKRQPRAPGAQDSDGADGSELPGL